MIRLPWVLVVLVVVAVVAVVTVEAFEAFDASGTLAVTLGQLSGGSSETLVFVSGNGGDDWLVAAEIPGVAVSVAYSTKAGAFFIPSYTGTLYTSTDGLTWSKVNIPITTGCSSFYDVAFSPDGSHGILICDQEFSSVYVTDDAGVTWTPSGAPLNYVADVCFVDDEGSAVVVSALYNEAMTTSDNGIDWTVVDAPTPPGDGASFAAVACNGTTAVGIVQVAGGSDTTSFLFDFSDNSTTKMPGAPENLAFRSVNGTTIGFLTAGLAVDEDNAAVSTDGGATWSFVDLPPAVAQINAVSVAPDGSLWFSTLVGLWRGSLADSGDYRAATAPSVVWDVPLNSSTPNGTYIELYDVAWSG